MIMNTPFSLATPPSCVPLTVICAPASGRPVPASVTRPVTVPVVCALAGVDTATTSAAARAIQPVRQTLDGAILCLLWREMDTKRNEAPLSFRNSAHPPGDWGARADGREPGYARRPAPRSNRTGPPAPQAPQ